MPATEAKQWPLPGPSSYRLPAVEPGCAVAEPAASFGGWTFPELPSLDAFSARTFWNAEHDPGVVSVDALPSRAGDPDALNLEKTGVEAIVLETPRGRDQLLLKERDRHIRIALRSGTLNAGPVRLRYAIEGLRDLEPGLMTLRRLAALWRLGRMPAELFPRETRAARWVAMLRTLDALEHGASHREIAESVLQNGRTGGDWRVNTEYLRTRVQRLVRAGKHMAGGGYLQLLRSRAG